tara:strand:- start:41 stop:469 length:429 start_codon:yes stop_codon:yes gene_type:complete
MPYTLEEQKEYDKNYYIKNKEKRTEQKKIWYEDNKDKNQIEKKLKSKTYRDKHKEKMKKYRQSPEGKRSIKISCWREYGMFCDDWDKLYEYYINCKNCEWCNAELTTDRYNTKTTRCLDHDHNTGLFRNVVCLSCNSSLPNQ